jgi:hypothetical protein
MLSLLKANLIKWYWFQMIKGFFIAWLLIIGGGILSKDIQKHGIDPKSMDFWLSVILIMAGWILMMRYPPDTHNPNDSQSNTDSKNLNR